MQYLNYDEFDQLVHHFFRLWGWTWVLVMNVTMKLLVRFVKTVFSLKLSLIIFKMYEAINQWSWKSIHL